MYKLAPSILAADFKTLGADIQEAVECGAEYIHIDVMDGMFVPNISYGMPVIASIRNATDKPFDVHLMVQEPIRYVEAVAKAGADIQCIHVEACRDVEVTLKAIKDVGCQAAIAIRPSTDMEQVKPYLNQVSMVLVMSVEPGFGGQVFHENTYERVRQVRKWSVEMGNPDMDIEVDGGVSLDNLEALLDAGVTVFVMGTAFFGEDRKEVGRKTQELFAKKEGERNE
ncbi:MAG: ribulose-phosphate 3-epimerase [Lachnospiraceae bacterium]